jgi:hypothetical protein
MMFCSLRSSASLRTPKVMKYSNWPWTLREALAAQSRTYVAKNGSTQICQGSQRRAVFLPLNKGISPFVFGWKSNHWYTGTIGDTKVEGVG